MKEEGINLITQQPAEKKVGKMLMTPSALIFAVIFIVGFGMILFSFILEGNLNSLKKQAEGIRAQIETQNVKKEKILITSERLASISKVLATRSDLDKLTAKILDSIPQNFHIDSINADSRQVVISFGHDSLLDFANLLDQTIPDLSKKNTSSIKTVELDSFVRSPSGYNIILRFNLLDKKNT